LIFNSQNSCSRFLARVENEIKKVLPESITIHRMNLKKGDNYTRTVTGRWFTTMPATFQKGNSEIQQKMQGCLHNGDKK
jgi:hypothetical protein